MSEYIIWYDIYCVCG